LGEGAIDMNDTPKDRDMLAVAWWNAGISYVKGRQRLPTRDHDERLRVAPQIVDLLMGRYGVDLLFLGEVGPDFGSRVLPYSWTWGGDGACRLGDMGCVVRDQKRTAMREAPRPISVSDWQNPASLDARIVQYTFAVEHIPLSVFSVHLHSDIHNQGAKRRQATAILLESVFRSERTISHVLVLGDMNEEPYGQGVSEVLKTSRSRRLCGRGSHLLYNPCWRLMHDHDGRLGGTARGNGEFAVWKVFDQVMMSSALLQDGSGLVFAGKCDVVEPLEYMKENKGGAVRVFDPFDHLPIVTEFEVNHE